MVMERSAGTSPSQPAGIPSAFNIARARQPVFPMESRRSKHRIVRAESWWRAMMFFRALYILNAPSEYLCRAEGPFAVNPALTSSANGPRPSTCTFSYSAIRSAIGISIRVTPTLRAISGRSASLEISQSEGAPITPSLLPSSLRRASETFARTPILEAIYPMFPWIISPVRP